MLKGRTYSEAFYHELQFWLNWLLKSFTAKSGIGHYIEGQSSALKHFHEKKQAKFDDNHNRLQKQSAQLIKQCHMVDHRDCDWCTSEHINYTIGVLGI